MLDAVRGRNYREATHERMDVVLRSAVRIVPDPFLSRAVDELPAARRKLIVLRFGDGLSQAETAAALGVSRRTVRREEGNAIAELRRQLRRAA